MAADTDMGKLLNNRDKKFTYSKVQKQLVYAFKAPNLKLASLNYEQTANYH